LSRVLSSEPGNLTPGRDSPAVPRLRSVNSYTNIRAATTARNLNKSLQNLNVSEEGAAHTHTHARTHADARTHTHTDTHNLMRKHALEHQDNDRAGNSNDSGVE